MCFCLLLFLAVFYVVVFSFLCRLVFLCLYCCIVVLMCFVLFNADLFNIVLLYWIFCGFFTLFFVVV